MTCAVLAVAEEQERLAAPLGLDPRPQLGGPRTVRVERRPAHGPSLLRAARTGPTKGGNGPHLRNRVSRGR